MDWLSKVDDALGDLLKPMSNTNNNDWNEEDIVASPHDQVFDALPNGFDAAAMRPVPPRRPPGRLTRRLVVPDDHSSSSEGDDDNDVAVSNNNDVEEEEEDDTMGSIPSPDQPRRVITLASVTKQRQLQQQRRRQQQEMAPRGGVPLSIEQREVSPASRDSSSQLSTGFSNNNNSSVEQQSTASSSLTAQSELDVKDDDHDRQLGEEQAFSVPTEGSTMEAPDLYQGKQDDLFGVDMAGLDPPSQIDPVPAATEQAKQNKSLRLEPVNEHNNLNFLSPLAPTAAVKGGEMSQQDYDELAMPLSLPQHIQFRSEFDVGDGEQLLSEWKDEINASPLHEDELRALNCYGVVHVRVLRAQRLQCSVGSSVRARVSLLPWKGRVHSEKATSFSTPDPSGVCVRWDEDTTPLSMVHAYSSSESPVPSIKVELMLSTLGSFLEITMCTLTLSCDILLRNPDVPQRQWFLTSVSGALEEVTGEDALLRTPILEMEAAFEPAHEGGHDVDSLLPSVPRDSLNDSASVLDDIAMSNNKPRRNSLNASVTSVNMDHSEAILLSPMRPRITSSISGVSDPPSEDVDTFSVSMASTMRRAGAPKPHHLRINTNWTPASCNICKSSMFSGLTKKSYYCEVCRIDCCADCRLTVDAKLPCGSEIARKARKVAAESKITVDKILNAVAPVENSKQSEGESRPEDSMRASFKENWLPEEENGIGTMKLEFFGAVVFDKVVPAHSEIADLKNNKDIKPRVGDYYLRVSWTGSPGSKRTPTIQNTGHPKFDLEEMHFNVAHYGVEFRIQLVDATNDEPIGTTLITTQSLLQLQRDSMIGQSGPAFASIFRGPLVFTGKQRMVLELRTGMKKGYSSEFFAPSKTQSSASDAAQPGDIAGLVELSAGIEEDTERLFGKAPVECAPRPPDELNMATFQVHLVRLSSFINDLKMVLATYSYVVSWENPWVTGISFVFFVRFCLKFNPAYYGSLIFFQLSMWMVYLAFCRTQGRLQNRELRKVLNELQKDQKTAVDYKLHRPAGLVQVAVDRGCNLVSPSLGLPGNVGCRIYWDPTRYSTETEKRTSNSVDTSTISTHDVGMGEYVYSSEPEWVGKNVESVEAKRLKQLLPSSADGEFFDKGQTKDMIEFPILQPLKSVKGDLLSLGPWAESTGAIVFEVKFHDTLNLLPGSEYSLGEVAIPLANLTENGELAGWFRVLEVGTTRTMAGASGGENMPVTDPSFEYYAPEIFIRLVWKGPGEGVNDVSETEREASYAIQEELIRSALHAKDKKNGLFGSSLGALNTVRGISDNLLLVQNTLGTILDIVGSVKNAFNFSDPFKSTVVLSVVVLLWFFFAMVPTQVLVFVGGMAQYAVTLHARVSPLLSRGRGKSKAVATPAQKDEPPSPYPVWIVNALRGLPTDEDLRKAYFWECRRMAIREMETQAESKRKSRLKRLWRAQWYSLVFLLHPTSSGEFERLEAFAMIQGHRFLWWHSIHDFDTGEEPAGRIFLAGHAGIATPSPLELRRVAKEDVHRLTGIFGRGAEKQERLTIVAPTDEVRNQLELAVAFATAAKKD